jgi:hypothetical protein
VTGLVDTTADREELGAVTESAGEATGLLALSCVPPEGPAATALTTKTANEAANTPAATPRLVIRAQRRRPRTNATNAIMNTMKPATLKKANNPDTVDPSSQRC